MVASEPEFTNRHCGSLKFFARISATAIESSVGSANWVPSSQRFLIVSTITGWACPWTMHPKPLWKSLSSSPSTLKMREPLPWVK